MILKKEKTILRTVEYSKGRYGRHRYCVRKINRHRQCRYQVLYRFLLSAMFASFNLIRELSVAGISGHTVRCSYRPFEGKDIVPEKKLWKIRRSNLDTNLIRV